MKFKFFQFFSALTLTLAIGLSPILACACQEPSQAEHACCPDNADSDNSQRQAQEKQNCCDMDQGVTEKFPEVNLSTPSSLVPGDTLPATVAKLPLLTAHRHFLWTAPGRGDLAPPGLYLIHHSLLL